MLMPDGPVRTMASNQQRGDEVPLDFVRSRVEAAGNGVSQLPLNFVFGHVAVSSVDLDGILTALDPAFADVQLGKGRLYDRGAAP